MFLFKRPLAAVLAGLVTAALGVLLDSMFSMAWATQHLLAAG